MADFWKSNVKKYCEFCKCWIADNKASIDFHERGKRHKENVALKLKNIFRQSAKDYKEKKKRNEDFKKMEKAALEAYQKDIERNADYTSQLLNQQFLARSTEITSTSVSIKKEMHDEEKIVGIKKEKIEHKKTVGIQMENIENEKKCKQWYEAVSNEGYTYYWNAVTGESIWDQPEEGYVSLQDQVENKVYLETEVKFEEATKNEDWVKKEREKVKGDEECLYREANRTLDITRRNEEWFKRKTEEVGKKQDMNWGYGEVTRTKEDVNKKRKEEWANQETKREMEEARKKQEQMELRAFIERQKMKIFRGEESSYTSSTFRSQGISHKVSHKVGHKVSPYGSWINIERCVQRPIDMQLPEQGHVRNNVAEYIPTEPEIRFKVKNIHSLEGQGNSNENFKTRKFSSSKKNMRQRQNDDY